MAKQDSKKSKIAVPEAGSGTQLKHNPFGALAEKKGKGTVLPNCFVPSQVHEASPAQSNLAGPSPSPSSWSPSPSSRAPSSSPSSRGRLILRREKKQRGGKTVVIVAGLRASAHLAESEIATLLQHLKQQLGCGGTVERVPNDTELVIQGDQPARVAELLRARDFRVDGVTS